MSEAALLLAALTFVVGIGLGSYIIRDKIRQLRRNVRTLEEPPPRSTRDPAWERLERDALHGTSGPGEKDPDADRDLWR